jgi:diphthine-ammonia ligase
MRLEYEKPPKTLDECLSLNGGFAGELCGQPVRDRIGIIPLFWGKNRHSYLKRPGYEEVMPGRLGSRAELSEFKLAPLLRLPPSRLKPELMARLKRAVFERIPGGKAGVLFSGGIDSTLICYLLKEMGHEPLCFTSGVRLEKEPEDVVYSKRVAKALGLKLRVCITSLDEVPALVRRVVSIIQDQNVVKVGVGLPMLAGLEGAKAAGCSVVFGGLGSEEVFAGYQRHRAAENVNLECLSGLKLMHERDTYRDFAIAEATGTSLRLPFLDRRLVEFALRIPAHLKLGEGLTKLILRQAAKDIGIPDWIACRKKRAAQYGSGFDKAMLKLAKASGTRYKKEYIKGLVDK